MKKIIKENKLFTIVFCLSLILHILSILSLGFNYNINSDDIRYIESGITLYNNHILTLYGTRTVQIMPGLSFFIAIIYSIFKSQKITVAALKIIYMIFSLVSLTYLYKTIKLFSSKVVSALSCLFLLTVDFIWMDNLILTETPYIMCFIMLIYYSLLFSENKKNIYFYISILLYIICLYIRPTIVIYPIIFLIYLILKKYNIKDLIKKYLIGLLIVLISLLPWWIRNYNIYNELILLTNGSGNPMYYGTYQGFNYPLDEELDYSVVENNMTSEMKEYLDGTNREKEEFINYYSLKKDKMMATYRMKKWFGKSPLLFIFSYLIYKPSMMLISSFYWTNLFHIPKILNIIIHSLELILCFISSIFIIKDKKYNKELFFLLGLYFYFLIVTSIGLSFSRYAMPIYFLRFIIDGIGLEIILKKYNKTKNDY